MSDTSELVTKTIAGAIDLLAENATLRAEIQTQRDCRLANEAELRRADTLIGELRAERDRLRAELEGVRADMDWLERRDVRVSNPRRYGEGECVIQTVLELEEDRTDLRNRIAALRRQS